MSQEDSLFQWILSDESEIPLAQRHIIVESLRSQGVTSTTVAKKLNDKEWDTLIPMIGFRATIRDYVHNQHQQLQERWTYSSNVYRGNFYHVPLKNLQLDVLVKRVNEGQPGLVQGAFRTGKTSHLIALSETIKDTFFPIEFRFGERFIKDFWGGISFFINRKCPKAPLISNADDFANFLTHRNIQQHFEGKRVVLLFDEFQLVEVHTEGKVFLDALRLVLEEVGERLCVQTAIGFGTSNIINLAVDETDISKVYSPFHSSHVIFIAPLPQVEVHQLLNRWATDRKIILPKVVADDIYNTVGGYAGLLGMVGLTLDNNIDYIQDQGGKVTIDVWFFIRQKCFYLLDDVTLYANLTQFVNKTPAILSLIQDIMLSPGPYIVDARDRQNAYILSTYGVLSMDPDRRVFKLTCPMVRELMVRYFYPKVPSFILPSRWHDDIQSFVQSVIPHMKLHYFYDNETKNFTTNFPSEYNFQADFFAVVRQGLESTDPTYRPSVEAKAAGMGKQRADILIRNGERILFELKAAQKWDQWNDAKPTMLQALNYSAFLECRKLVVINFTPRSSNFSNVVINLSSGKQMYMFQVVWKDNKLTCVNTIETIFDNIDDIAMQDDDETMEE